MNVIILTQQPDNYSNTRLIHTLQARHHTVSPISAQKCTAKIGTGLSEVLFNNTTLTGCDVVLPRSSGYTWHGITVIKPLEYLIATQLKLAGALSINDPEAKRHAHNKFLTLQLLAQAGLPIPTSALTWNPEDVPNLIANTLDTPTILKLNEGTWGVGVIRADSPESTHATYDTIRALGRVFFLQSYIAESAGQDIRAFVIGNQVVAAIRRSAKGNDFRSNIHQGGKAESITLSDHYVDLALTAAQTLNLDVAGVDILETNDGPVIIEVNPSPGLEAIETTTNIDIAGKIVDYIEQRLKQNLLPSSPSVLV